MERCFGCFDKIYSKLKCSHIQKSSKEMLITKVAFKAFKNLHTGSLDNTASSFLNFPFDTVELI